MSTRGGQHAGLRTKAHQCAHVNARVHMRCACACARACVCAPRARARTCLRLCTFAYDHFRASCRHVAAESRRGRLRDVSPL
eukprot:5794522-Pleurochrysis_carterae.AAC.3